MRHGKKVDGPAMTLLSHISTSRMLKIARHAVVWLTGTFAICPQTTTVGRYLILVVIGGKELTCWDWCLRHWLFEVRILVEQII